MKSNTSSAPLLSEHKSINSPISSPKKGWTTAISSRLSGKDDLTISIEKATNDDAGGRPKEKHISFIISEIERDPTQVDSILIKLNALTEWSQSVVSAGKVLIILQEILQKIRAQHGNFENFIIFLTEIRNQYKDINIPLIDRHTMGLIGHTKMLNEFRELSSVLFNDSFSFAFSKSKLSMYEPNIIVLFLTRLLSYQDNLISVLNTDPYSAAATITLTTPSIQTLEEIKVLVRKESKIIQKLLLNLLSYAEQQRWEGIQLEYLREQCEAQNTLLP